MNSLLLRLQLISAASGRTLRIVFIVLAGLSINSVLPAQAPINPSNANVNGTVRDSSGQPIQDASVTVQQKGKSNIIKTKTHSDGTFRIGPLASGAYLMKVEGQAGHTAIVQDLILSAGEQKNLLIDLAPAENLKSTKLAGSEMQLADKPNFTIAGISDWTAGGGHGSDSNLRTSEALARDTAALKGSANAGTAGGSGGQESEKQLRAAFVKDPRSFETNHALGEFYFRAQRYREAIPFLSSAYQVNPGERGNALNLAIAYMENREFVAARQQTERLLANENNADAHRLLGDIDEKLGDPLAAVREYEQATRLDASEQNYFSWGTELLLHRAVRPAIDVFSRGARAYPRSARVLAGLGAALYASGEYQHAAQRLCEASDLQPTQTAPYLFLGKMQKAVTEPLPCSEERLARFAVNEAGNPLANYYYAISILRRAAISDDSPGLKRAQQLLQKAVDLDRKFGESYLELGGLHFSAGELQLAITLYKKAIDANPNLVEAHYRLGTAYKKTGEHEKAGREFQVYEQLKRTEAEQVERQRHEIRQFLVVLKEQSPSH
jgi:tetratricopeptide (TPR) repeat protein